MMPEKVRLPPELQQKLFDAALAQPEQEVCGLLGGHANALHSIYPVANIDPDARHAFLLEPQGQIAAMRAMRERGESLRGIYHSHPDTSAAPSARDRQLAAYPDTYYLIVSLQSSLPDIRAFYFDGNDFFCSPIISC